MPSQREIARDWGCAPSYVAKCVTQRCCPTTSFEEARQWREENARRRAPTNNKSTKRKLAEQQTQKARKGSTLIPLARAKATAFRGYDLIIDLLVQLPQRVAAQCDLEDAQISTLESECTVALCRAGDAYALWPRD
jgi:hypothetical protein